MGLYKGPSCKLCRREGVKLFLKSQRCDTPKCAFERRKYIPGQHGPVSRIKLSEYGIRLREKQKLKRFYYISEGQMRRYYDMANAMHGDTGEELLQVLESRLDNVVFRLGLADTRMQSRLFVRHGHFLVNGSKVDIPSYILKANDSLVVRDSSKKSFEPFLAKSTKNKLVNWLVADYDANRYTYTRMPSRDELDIPINEQFVIEYYSR